MNKEISSYLRRMQYRNTETRYRKIENIKGRKRYIQDRDVKNTSFMIRRTSVDNTIMTNAIFFLFKRRLKSFISIPFSSSMNM